MRNWKVFDLATTDVFRPGDVVCTFRKGDQATVKKLTEVMKAQGMEIWAYSDHGEYQQYLFVPDIEERKAVVLASDRNSAGFMTKQETRKEQTTDLVKKVDIATYAS